MENQNADKKAKIGDLVTIPHIIDERGSLCVAENSSLPFEVKRVFWIHDVQEGQTRGGHAHRTCAEVVFPVTGSFDIYIDDGKNRKTIHLDSPHKGIHIRPNVWCCLKNFAQNTVCVVLASQEYEAEGYIHDYTTFKKMFG